MQDRLQDFLEAEQLSSSRFADAIGVQRSSISHILSGRNKPSYDFLQKVVKAFPYVSAEWLLSGVGSMYKDSLGTVKEREIFAGSDAVSPAKESHTPKAAPPIQEEIVKGKEKIGNTPELQARELKRVILMYSDNSFESFEPQR